MLKAVVVLLPVLPSTSVGVFIAVVVTEPVVCAVLVSTKPNAPPTPPSAQARATGVAADAQAASDIGIRAMVALEGWPDEQHAVLAAGNIKAGDGGCAGGTGAACGGRLSV